MVQEAIHGGGGEEGVAEEGIPLGDVAVGGDEGGAPFVALADDLVEVHRLIVGERPEAEVINDEEPRRGETGQLAIVAAVAAGGAEGGEHLVGGDVEGAVARQTGSLTNGLGEVGLADTGRADEYEVGVGVEEATGS